MANVHTMDDLRQYQAMPLPIKIAMSETRIRAWVNEFGTDGVYVSFSGGKDSTVLLHMVRKLYPDVPGVFVDTGLEYPEIRDFVKTFDNIVWLKPKMNFRQVVEKYGYPFFSKETASAIEESRKYLTAYEERLTIIKNRTEQNRTEQNRTEQNRTEQLYHALLLCNERFTRDPKEGNDKEEQGNTTTKDGEYP